MSAPTMIRRRWARKQTVTAIARRLAPTLWPRRASSDLPEVAVGLSFRLDRHGARVRLYAPAWALRALNREDLDRAGAELGEMLGGLWETWRPAPTTPDRADVLTFERHTLPTLAPTMMPWRSGERRTSLPLGTDTTGAPVVDSWDLTRHLRLAGPEGTALARAVAARAMSAGSRVTYLYGDNGLYGDDARPSGLVDLAPHLFLLSADRLPSHARAALDHLEAMAEERRAELHHRSTEQTYPLVVVEDLNELALWGGRTRTRAALRLLSASGVRLVTVERTGSDLGRLLPNDRTTLVALGRLSAQSRMELFGTSGPRVTLPRSARGRGAAVIGRMGIVAERVARVAYLPDGPLYGFMPEPEPLSWWNPREDPTPHAGKTTRLVGAGEPE